jgi:hypothetical protein
VIIAVLNRKLKNKKNQTSDFGRKNWRKSIRKTPAIPSPSD